MDLLILFIGILLVLKHKYAWALLALLALTTSYLGVGSNLSSFPINHNVSDSGLILFGFMSFYMLWRNKFVIKRNKLTFYVEIFYIFLFISILIDLFFNHISIISIIKTSRHWIFLSSVWLFYYIPRQETEKLIRYLLNITFVISILLLFDFFTDWGILKQINIQYTTSGMVSKRGAIPSTFTVFFILLLFSNYLKLNARKKYTYLAVLSAVLVVSMIRSWLIATLIGIFIIYIYSNTKIRKKNTFPILFILIILIGGAVSNSLIKARFQEGFSDIQNFNLKGDVEGNFSYRIFHSIERLEYITSDFQYTLFGIGNVTEENAKTNFLYGIRNEYGRIAQLDTADIAWSILFIRLGILGTILYVIIFIKLILFFKSIRKQNLLALTLFSFLTIELLFISLASGELANGSFILFPIIIYYYLKNHEKSTLSYHRNPIV